MNTIKSKQLSDVSVKQAAQFLNVCPNKLFGFLRTHNIFTAENMPYGKYTAKGHFRVRLTSTPRKAIYMQPRVTATGLTFIKELLDGNPEEAQAIRRRDKQTRKAKSPRPSTQKRANTSAATG